MQLLDAAPSFRDDQRSAGLQPIHAGTNRNIGCGERILDVNEIKRDLNNRFYFHRVSNRRLDFSPSPFPPSRGLSSNPPFHTAYAVGYDLSPCGLGTMKA